MTKQKRQVPAYIFGSAKAGQTTAAKEGRSRVKPLPTADELLKGKEETGPVEQVSIAPDFLHNILTEILTICETPGRSADKVRKIEVLALAGLAG